MNPWRERFRMAWQMVWGLAWLSILAFIGSAILDIPFGIMLLAILGMVGCCSALGLVWIYQWASRKESKLGQFNIGSLFFASAFVAAGGLFFSLFKPMLDIYGWPPVQYFYIWIPLGLIFLLFTGLCVVRITESVLWCGVWFVKLPWSQAILRRWREKRK